MARLVSADQSISLISGVSTTFSCSSSAAIHSAAQLRSAGIVDIAQRLERQRAVRAQVVMRAAHRQHRGARGIALVEDIDLAIRDSGGTAAPSTPAAPTCRRPSARRSACGRHRRHGWKSGTASSRWSRHGTAAAPSRCSLRVGPAQTDDSGIRWARLRVWTRAGGHWHRHGPADCRARLPRR